MPLVEYSDSESSECSRPVEIQSKNKAGQGVKRKRGSDSTLPPLPDAFHDLYASTSRISNQDDPSLHGGRQRVLPHADGNWPTHVYIDCESLSKKHSSTRCLGCLLTETRVSINRTIETARLFFEKSQPCSKSRLVKSANPVEK
jgi:hypothetical protein